MTTMTVKQTGSRLLCAGILLGTFVTPAAQARAPKKNSPAELRSDYISRLQEQDVVSPETHGRQSVDFRRRQRSFLGLQGAQTERHGRDSCCGADTAAQSGDVNSSRAFQTSSAITGLAGDVKTKGLNPLFNANSTTTLKGSGATDSSTTFQTSMTGAGDRGAAQRQPGGGSAAQDLHEQPARGRDDSRSCAPRTILVRTTPSPRRR